MIGRGLTLAGHNGQRAPVALHSLASNEPVQGSKTGKLR